MKWLRERNGAMETAWISDKHDGRTLADASDRLGDAVLILKHPYNRNSASGSGNCWCGRAEGEGTIHDVFIDPGYPSKQPKGEQT